MRIDEGSDRRDRSVSPKAVRRVAPVRRLYHGLVCAAVAILAIGCRPSGDIDAAERPVPLVEAIRVEQGDSTTIVEAIGTVVFRREIDLGFTSPGKVSYVRAEEGQEVPAAFVLAGLDTTIAQADLSQALAERVRAAEAFARIDALRDGGWVTRGEWESARAALESAEAGVATARFQTSSATIRAPSAGIVLARLVEPGQIVEAGRPIVTFGDLAKGLAIRGGVSGAEASRIRRGASVRVAIASASPIVLAATIVEIGGRADPETGLFPVEAILTGPSAVRAGQIGTMAIDATASERDRDRPVVGIPLRSLFGARAGEGFVLRYDPETGKMVDRKVTFGELKGDRVEIVGGLAPGDIIAAYHTGEIAGGQSVRVKLLPGP